MIGGTASGIISERVANELARQQHVVKIVTQNGARDNLIESIQVYEIQSILNDNSIIFRILRKLGRYFQFYFFENDHLWPFMCRKIIDNIYNEWKPDLVYCRSTPHDPFFIGKYIKRKYGSKVLMHFTDPLPMVTEYSTKPRLIEQGKKQIIDLIKYADYLSFGTKEMIEWEENILGQTLNIYSFESPDVASDTKQRYLKIPPHSSIRMVYYGSINVSRNPIPLFEALEHLRKNGLNCELFIYSDQASKFNRYDGVYFVGRANNRDDIFASADILVDLAIEACYGKDVFISSKLKDYLLYNRPILSIAGEKSATRSLLRGLDTILISRNTVDEIMISIKTLVNQKLNNDDYNDRKKVIDKFNPSLIAKSIIDAVSIQNSKDI